MWGTTVSNPPHLHYVPGANGPIGVGPSGPILSGPPNARHLRPQSSYSLPHGSNGPSRWGWHANGSHASSFDRRQVKSQPPPPQPTRPAPVVRPTKRETVTNVSIINCNLQLISLKKKIVLINNT